MTGRLKLICSCCKRVVTEKSLKIHKKADNKCVNKLLCGERVECHNYGAGHWVENISETFDITHLFY